jgi:RNA polymerase sigma-70 factor (ECF subfamily)
LPRKTQSPAKPASRSNSAWLTALRGQEEDSAEAIRDLGGYLQRVLRKVVAGRLGAEAVAELVQESVVRIVRGLDSFRGDSSFTTWAAAIATRVGFNELRRRSARERRQREFDETMKEARELAERRSPSPTEALSKADLLQALEGAIATSLTGRQRTAILAELRGIPSAVIADRLGTNQNALYKLIHDSRKKLRSALLQAGFTAGSLGRRTSEATR